MNDPSINQLGELDEVEGDATDQTTRFRDWLRSNGWAVITEHRGPLRIGGELVDQIGHVAAEFDLRCFLGAIRPQLISLAHWES